MTFDLNTLHNDIWIIDGPDIDAMGGFHFPTRMVIVRLPNGELWVWSPVAFSPELAAKVAERGTVAHLICPNHLHNMSITDWAQVFPDATIWVEPRLYKKRPDLQNARALDGSNLSTWQRQIDRRLLKNHITNEYVFHHIPSKTMIITDILQSLPQNWFQGWRGLIAKMDLMTQPTPTIPRKYRVGFKGIDNHETIQWMLNADAERIIIAHGPITQTNAPALLRTAFSPYL